jgi:hypothetical protein
MNTNIQDHYVTAHAQATAYIEALAERLDDFAAPSDKTNWSDVANLAHLVDQLREIAEPAE